jgi:hypothetical protein
MMATVSSTGALSRFRFVTCVEAVSDFLRRGKTRMARLCSTIALAGKEIPCSSCKSCADSSGRFVAMCFYCAAECVCNNGSFGGLFVRVYVRKSGKSRKTESPEFLNRRIIAFQFVED